MNECSNDIGGTLKGQANSSPKLSSVQEKARARCNVQVVTHSYSGVNEALVQGVGFSNRKGARITRNKNAGSCDFHKLIAAKPLDLKGYDGNLNCTEWEHSKR